LGNTPSAPENTTPPAETSPLITQGRKLPLGRVAALAVESGAGGDSCAGDDQQDAAAFRDVFGRTAKGGYERSGVHMLVVCDGDPFDGYIEQGGECGAVAVPGGSSDDDVDIGGGERGLVEAVAGRLGGGFCELRSTAADSLKRSTLR
jgi:hypothetical protein